MSDPTLYIASGVTALAALAMLSLVALKGWHSWIALKRDELAHGALPHAGDTAGIGNAVKRWLESERPVSGTVYDRALAAFERPLFMEVLKVTGGNQLRAAQLLGINRNTLRKRLSELAIDPEACAREG